MPRDAFMHTRYQGAPRRASLPVAPFVFIGETIKIEETDDNS